MSPEDGRGSRRYAGKSTEERRADRRRRLLDAALERFGTQGFRSTTVTDLCRTAGVAPIHFYEEYPGREALLEDLYDEIMDSTRAEVDAALDTCADPSMQARTQVGLDAYCHAMLDDPRRARVQCIEIVGVSPAMELRRHDGLIRYARLVVDSFLLFGWHGDPLARDEQVDPAAVAALDEDGRLRSMGIALVGGVNEVMIDWLMLETRPPISALVEAMTDLWVANGLHLARRLA